RTATTRHNLWQAVVVLVVELDAGGLPAIIVVDRTSGAFGDGESVVTGFMPMIVTQTGAADQPVELGRHSLRVDRDGHHIAGRIRRFLARDECTRLVGDQRYELILKDAVVSEKDTHDHRITRIRVGQRDERVDFVRSGRIARVFMEEKDATRLGAAGGTARRVRSDLWHTGADLGLRGIEFSPR